MFNYVLVLSDGLNVDSEVRNILNAIKKRVPEEKNAPTAFKKKCWLQPVTKNR